MHFTSVFYFIEVFTSGEGAKNPPPNAGDPREACSITGSRWSTGGGNGDPLQYSCLENSMDRGAWQASVHEFIELDAIEHVSIILSIL